MYSCIEAYRTSFWRRSISRAGPLFALALSLSSPGIAAKIDAESVNDKQVAIELSGEIAAGDAARFRQVVAEVFQFSAQRRIIKHKPGVILDHAQGLAGAVGVGVEDAQDGSVHAESRKGPIIGPRARAR